MHDPSGQRAANGAFRKPRGFNQPVKVNAGFNAHLVTEKYHIFRADIAGTPRIAMAGKGATAQPGDGAIE
jgi:hypothetical protein